MNGSRSKFLPKSIRQPISQNHRKPLNLGYERVAMNELSPSEKPYVAARKQKSQHDANRRTELLRPVRLVAQTGQTGRGGKFKLQTGQTGCTDRSDRSLPDSPPTKLQMSNLEQTKSKSNETWRKASHLPHEHIPKRSFPEDSQIVRN